MARRTNDLVAFAVGMGVLWGLTWAVRSRTGLGLTNLSGNGLGIDVSAARAAAQAAAARLIAARTAAPSAATATAAAAATTAASASSPAAVVASVLSPVSSSGGGGEGGDEYWKDKDKVSAKEHASSTMGTGMIAASAPGVASSLSLEQRAGRALMALGQAATLVPPASTVYVMTPPSATQAIKSVETQRWTLGRSLLQGERNRRKLESWVVGF